MIPSKTQIILTINKAIVERDKYNSSVNKMGHKNLEIYLQTAANLMHKAYTMVIKAITRKEIKTTHGINVEAMKLNDFEIRQLYFVVRELHSYWYDGKGFEGISPGFNDAKELMVNIIKKYNIR